MGYVLVMEIRAASHDGSFGVASLSERPVPSGHRPWATSPGLRSARFLLGVACIGALFGCGEDEIITSESAPEAEPEARASQDPSRQEDFLYDEDGALRESDEVVAGLTMPRGLELSYEEDRRHVYESNVPRQKLLEYFGPRLFTGAVDELGGGAVYRAATVRGEGASSVRLDVSIIRLGSRSRVEVFELPPMPENPLPPAELERQYREAMRRAE